MLRIAASTHAELTLVMVDLEVKRFLPTSPMGTTLCRHGAEVMGFPHAKFSESDRREVAVAVY